MMEDPWAAQGAEAEARMALARASARGDLQKVKELVEASPGRASIFLPGAGFAQVCSAIAGEPEIEAPRDPAPGEDLQEGCLRWTPLMWAAACGAQACVEWLASREDSLEGFARDAEGRDALMLAAMRGQEGCALALAGGLEGRAALVDARGRSALWWAIAGGSVECVRALADSTPRRKEEQSPFMAALALRRPDCAMALLGASDPEERDEEGNSGMHHAAALGWADCAQALLDRGWACEKGVRGFTPLHLAAASGSAECVALLMPRSDAAEVDDLGATPLVWAARNGKADCVKLLLPVSDPLRADGLGSPKAAWEPARMSGRTALMGAAEGGHLDCVRLLWEASDPRAVDSEGRSALGAAAAQGRADCVAFLLALGERGSSQDARWTALVEAARAGSEECVEMLLPWASQVAPAAAEMARAAGREGVASRIEAWLAEADREALARAVGVQVKDQAKSARL